MAGADGVEKLEDVIVRSAEQVAGQIRAARKRFHRHFRPGPSDRKHLGDDPVRRSCASDRRSRSRQNAGSVETLGITLGLDTKRIQFTPDLMPSDILGAEVLDESSSGRRSFRSSGPVFAQLLMADEINRASPRTQSALLQAMQEQHITVAGARHDLPKPFHVLATQNPLEQEGTYPLPKRSSIAS